MPRRGLCRPKVFFAWAQVFRNASAIRSYSSGEGRLGGLEEAAPVPGHTFGPLLPPAAQWFTAMVGW